jgi:glutathione S-transferase
MSELQIIGGAASNFVWTVRIALTEKGVPYQHVAAMPHTPEVDAVHPFGKIPVLRHGEVALAESRAICGYIDRRFDGPRLFPADPVKAAQLEQWVSIVVTHIDQTWLRQYLIAYVFPGTPDGSPDRARIEAAVPKLAQQFPVMERAVAGGYLCGDTFTLADMYFTPILYYMQRGAESAALLAQSPNLKAYLERNMARRSVQETLPQTFPGQAGRSQGQSDGTRAA